LPERVDLTVVASRDVHGRDTAIALNVAQNVGAEEEEIVVRMGHHIESRARARCRLYGACRRAEQDDQATQQSYRNCLPSVPERRHERGDDNSLYRSLAR